MDDVQMGLAFDGLNRSDMRQARGILGVGFESSESAVIRYPNLVSQLVLNGHINSRAYSIWLDDYGKFHAIGDWDLADPSSSRCCDWQSTLWRC